MNQLLDCIDDYCDAVPRSAARVEEIGSFVFFVPQAHPWPYYARPRRRGPAPGAGDVPRVRERQRDLGLPEAFEGIADVTPGLLEAGRAAGLAVTEHPLMVLEGAQAAVQPEGAELRLVTPDDDLAELGACRTAASRIPARRGAQRAWRSCGSERPRAPTRS